MSKSESRKKTQTIQVRATPTEKESLKSRADAFGISVGELVRQTIFSTKPKSKTDLESIQVLAASRADLGRVGGLLKGWLAGSFPDSPAPDQMQIRALLHKIEIAQSGVLAAVKKLVDKA
jgi:predicted aconitase